MQQCKPDSGVWTDYMDLLLTCQGAYCVQESWTLHRDAYWPSITGQGSN
jgi:hypothetical protein